MRSKSFYLLLALLYCTQSFAQSAFTLKGIVKDATSGESLPFATVFFAETTYGTTSKDDGTYELVVKSAGTYDLIVKFVGYKTYVAQVTLGESELAEFDILISPDTKDLGSVVVSAKKDRNWESNMIEFRRIFLGESDNARQSKILNEEVVDFIDDIETRTLEAYAQEPIIVENNALGYEITYYLESFIVDYNSNLSTYFGYTIFKEMKSRNKRKQRTWENNRKLAYEGSPVHFFTSLYENKLQDEGFLVQKAQDIEGVGRVLDPREAQLFDSLKGGKSNISKQLPFENILYITFQKEYESELYQKRTNRTPGRLSVGKVEKNKPQQSWISMLDDNRSIEFEPNGYIYNPTAYYSAGYWGFEKVAEMLPIDYRPKKEN
ncbi:carboxypeptidase-like regulatory domain-containing protein [Roseivirga sp.]|uniref:carboxypeptidase-like regulatory domain-containing protein n=1 Tax=Roseivirga sp. TaxID=1964215 RepID=UPI003B8C9709